MANEPPSIFRDGKLKSGIYKICNVFTETYADIEVHSRHKWEIKPLGAGYSVRRVEPGKPEQFCMPMDELKNLPLCVAPYPVAWRLEIVDDIKHRGFEYVRFCWGITEWSWAISNWSKDNGAKVTNWTDNNRNSIPLLMWKLIPVKIEGVR